MKVLCQLFPEEISVAVVRADRRLVAGAVFFGCFPVLHLQYVATSEDGMALERPTS